MVWPVARVVCPLYFGIFHQARYIGRENIPREGPAILASNHVSYLDPPLVATGSPRKTFFIAWSAIFTWPIVGRLVGATGALSVDTDRPDKRAIKAGLSVLRRGEVLGIFPEGVRSPDGRVGHMRPGAALLAFETGAPIVPVTVVGGFKVWPAHHILPRPGRLAVHYHEPIRFQKERGLDKAARKVYLREVTERLAATIAAKLAECERPKAGRTAVKART